MSQNERNNIKRELFGYTFIFGVVVLVLLAASRFKKDVQKPIPKLRYLYSTVVKKRKIES